MRPLKVRLMAATLVFLMALHGAVVYAGDEVNQRLPTDTTTFYLIRHAEKEITAEPDPDLTEQGRFRAGKWAEVFKHIDLDAVYSTDTSRTRSTAARIAQSQSRQIEIYAWNDIDFASFLKQNLNKSVLVVGHSNTTPAFANGLLGVERYADLDESNYSTLFIVEIVGDKRIGKMLYIDAQLK